MVEYCIDVSDEDDEKLKEIAEKEGLPFDIGVLTILERMAHDLAVSEERLTHTEK